MSLKINNGGKYLWVVTALDISMESGEDQQNMWLCDNLIDATLLRDGIDGDDNYINVPLAPIRCFVRSHENEN